MWSVSTIVKQRSALSKAAVKKPRPPSTAPTKSHLYAPVLAFPPQPVATVTPEPLTSAEQEELERCEQKIETGLHTFFETGQALFTIKEKRLYRNSFANFEAYCRSRWDMSRFYAYRLIGAAEVTTHLLTDVNIPAPVNEAQVRPLAKIPSDQVSAVWKRAAELADKGKITSHHVKRALSEFAQPSSPPTVGSPREKEPPSKLPTGKLLQLIRELGKWVRQGGRTEALRCIKLIAKALAKT